MTDYHAIQLTGSACQGRNCACASCAMAIAYGTDNRILLSSDQVRHESGVSCIPTVDTPSGGLFISDVRRVAYKHGVTIDYGTGPGGFYRWPSTMAKHMLSSNHGGIFLGDYDQIPAPYRAPHSSFQGDHSAWAHDYRSDNTVCWHDPLRSAPIRLPLGVLLAYWQKAGSLVKGLAGFVIKPVPASLWGPDVPADIQAVNPSGWTVGEAIKLAKKTGGHPPDFGSVINMQDLRDAFDAIGLNYGPADRPRSTWVVNPVDVTSLVNWYRAHK